MKVVFIFSSILALSRVVTSEHHDWFLRGKKEFESENVRSLQIGVDVGAVVKWRLINATAGNKGQIIIDPILNGTIVDLANFPVNQQFSVEAVTSNLTGPVASVRYIFANKNNFRTDNVVPFSLCGDLAKNVYRPCSQLVEGIHTIAATPYSLVKATGMKGQQSKVSFTIIKTITTDSPSSYPTESPSFAPSESPTIMPNASPSISPSESPSMAPTINAPAQWIETNPNAPINARHEACFVMVGRKAYLLLGRGKQAVNIYDPVTRTWTNGTAPPIQIHHTQCVVANDSIWVVSSWTGGYPMEKSTDKIYIYNTLTNTWSTKAGLPIDRRRGGAAAVLVGDKIYVSHGNIGGHETGNFSTTLGWLDYYDISEDKWYTNLTDAPNPRDHAGGGLVNGRICVAGGRDGGDIDFYNKVILPTDCYDPATSTWSQEANIPYGRGGSSYGTTCDGKLMVAGGEGGSKTASKEAWANVDVFDGTSWTSMSSLNVARHGSGLAVDCHCNQIYIASGAHTRGGRYEITSVETLFPNGVDVPCIA